MTVRTVRIEDTCPKRLIMAQRLRRILTAATLLVAFGWSQAAVAQSTNARVSSFPSDQLTQYDGESLLPKGTIDSNQLTKDIVGMKHGFIKIRRKDGTGDVWIDQMAVEIKQSKGDCIVRSSPSERPTTTTSTYGFGGCDQ